VAERVVVLAQDLIWRDRLVRAAEAAGLEPVAVTGRAALDASMGEGIRLAVIDLTAHAYDGLEAVAAAAGLGARVLAVGQHDDHAGRKAALAAGAERVLAYRKLFEDGPRTLAGWAAAPSVSSRA
jgi:DNA-binding response OmpR family regulator